MSRLRPMEPPTVVEMPACGNSARGMARLAEDRAVLLFAMRRLCVLAHALSLRELEAIANEAISIATEER